MSLSDDEDLECPLCMEEIDITDKYFKPCPCGYQICRFCWNHIKENLSGLCPACRRPYLEENVEFKPVSAEELAQVKNAKKRKEREKKEQDMAARKQLANVRVVQKNLVYVLGLPPKLASEEILKSYDYFGQYGKITKVVVNRKTSGGSGGGNIGIYITYSKKEDAAKAIEAVDGSIYEGRVVRATFGTTKYCSYFLKGQNCQNAGCQFLHEPGEETDTFVKDESAHQAARERSGKPVAFPIGRKEDPAEPTLPATANWAKQPQSQSQTQSQISLNNPAQFPSLAQAVSNEPVSELTGHAKESSTERQQTPEPSVTNTQKSTATKKETASVPVSLKVLCFDFPDAMTEKVGYGLVPQYSGLFNPFEEEEILSIQALLQLRSVNSLGAVAGAKNLASGQKIAPPPMGKQAAAGMDLKGNASRFERLFDDGTVRPAQTQETLRAFFPNANVSFGGPTETPEARWGENMSPSRFTAAPARGTTGMGGVWSASGVQPQPTGLAPYQQTQPVNAAAAALRGATPANFHFLTPQQQQQYLAYMQQEMLAPSAAATNPAQNGWL